MAQNVVVIGMKYFFIDLFGGVVGFPIWWYTRGLANTARFCFGSIGRQWQNLGLGVWLKNLFVPMYGETELSGRLISIFMRFVVLIGKGIAFIVWSIILVTLFVIYLLLLPLVVLVIVVNIIGFNNPYYGML